MKRPALAQMLRSVPAATAALVEVLLEAADATDTCVFLVGGPVRDHLLGRPLRDVDLLVEGATGLSVEELAERATAPDARSTRHGRFGTVSLRQGEGEVDLATARSESYSHDGALPSVGPGTLEQDLRRRDFSVNALALPLSKVARSRHAGIVDLEDGIADLEQRHLRVLHPRSFHDDPTRALRAARLAPRLSFSLTRGSRSAMRDALRDGAFSRVSGDRLRREFVKLFDDAAAGLDPARALKLLDSWHVLGVLEPGLAFPREAVAAVRRVGRDVQMPPWRRGRWRPWVSGLCVWLAPLAPGLRRRALRRFAVSGDVGRRIAEFPRARDGWLRALARARGRGATDSVLAALEEDALHALFASADPPTRRRIARYVNEDRGRRAPINGADLVDIGLCGPAVGRALIRVRVAFLDGTVRTREEALALARELARRRGARGTGTTRSRG